MSCYNAEMKKGRKDVLAWMLCLVMLAGAVACTGEKGASGQKGAAPEVQRGKQAVTHGMHREKRCTPVNFATEEVVVENNYLSQKQQAQKDKEIAACQSVSCKAGAQAKWTAIDLGQDGSFAAGMVAGVPAALYDTVDGIVKTASSPVETYQALKALFNSGDVLGNVSDAVKQSYIDRIDRMETQYQQAGASGSFNAGVEGGKLVTDIAGLLAGGAGIVKGGVVLTEKVVAKTTGMVETALKSSVINKILEADRIGSGLKPDPTHRDASYLSREQLMDGKVFTIKGGDGIERKLLQAEGSFNDKKSIF